MASKAEGTATQAVDQDHSSDQEKPATDSLKKRFALRDELSEVKSIMDGTTPLETKCLMLHKKYQQLVREYKRIERRLVECQRKQLEVTQHRDIIQNEYTRTNLAKTKLESLCRELQRHSKTVAEESKQRAREEEEKRKEVSEKFQKTINEITLKMQEHHHRNQSLKQENLDLGGKLKQLVEQYEAREEQFEKVLKQKQLEVQLCEAKSAQQAAAAAEDKEKSLAERQYLMTETLEQHKRCEQLTKQEADLRQQLSLYSDKFEQFQDTLTKSNEVFTNFKKEMDKMSKSMQSLERENILWKTRYEKCNKSLLEMAQERAVHEQSIQAMKVKNEKLEKLCRAMQMQRRTADSKRHNEERTTVLNGNANGDSDGSGFNSADKKEQDSTAVDEEAAILSSGGVCSNSHSSDAQDQQQEEGEGEGEREGKGVEEPQPPQSNVTEHEEPETLDTHTPTEENEGKLKQDEEKMMKEEEEEADEKEALLGEGEGPTDSGAEHGSDKTPAIETEDTSTDHESSASTSASAVPNCCEERRDNTVTVQS